jgi:acyl-CoA synthetase (AMP-forming)/AMP-acid ligase II
MSKKGKPRAASDAQTLVEIRDQGPGFDPKGVPDPEPEGKVVKTDSGLQYQDLKVGTGDVAKITPDSWLLIVDRTKDLVKSGGEWISSIDVENAALAVKGVAICAVIGVPHPKWHERPLLVVVKAPGANPTKAEILDVLGAKIAKWQMPDDVVFVDALPMTATGKISKKDLRAKFADHKLPA